MRVLHVETGRHLYGGARQVLYLMQGLKARGHDNLLVCQQGSPLAQAALPFAQVYALRLSGDLDARLVRRLRSLIDLSKPDLLHLHSRRGADLWGGVAGRLGDIPVILSRRVDNPEPAWLVPLKYQLYDRVIAISQGIGEVLRALGVPAAKIRVVRSAIDPGVTAGGEQQEIPVPRIRARLGLTEHDLAIGVIAQLIPRKGHRVLLAALPELIRAYPRLQVFCFGQGPLDQDLQQEIADRGLRGHVHLMGFRQDLPELLPALDLVVHPALMEGLGIALLEAAAAGLPIVASQVGGIPEAVHHGLNGLLVPPGDAQSLGTAIATLLADPGRRRAYGLAGQGLIRQGFSVEAMVEGNLAVYRELIP